MEKILAGLILLFLAMSPFNKMYAERNEKIREDF